MVEKSDFEGMVTSATRDSLGRRLPALRERWAKQDYEHARHIIKVAQALLEVEYDRLFPFLYMIIPFVQRCRRTFVESGFLSFSGVLARARNLVRDHAHIRRDLKQHIRAVLVDEFQDTDPIQYELLLYLSEKIGQEAKSWQLLSLEPGKLFIVGDPKQSIYAFRRADMEAFDIVVNDLVLAGSTPGEAQCLETNFRSHAGVLGPINRCFSRLFPADPQKGLQPSYESLRAEQGASPPLDEEAVKVRLVSLTDPNADADMATRVEAESLAKWLKEDLIGQDTIGEQGKAVSIQPHHVALIFRTLTQAPVYLEALRRYGVPYRTEGEKHFYRRQEIIDGVNVLRVVVNPNDQLALAGVLRSPLGGIDDSELERLARNQQLDIRAASHASARECPPVYRALLILHQRLSFLPLEQVVDMIWAHIPMVELAAASQDGEQALANLMKFREIIVELSQDPNMSLTKLTTILSSRIASPPAESEMALQEEGQEQDKDGAMQILSIHKAKGLEFPVVIFAGLHRGADQREPLVSVQHDWTSEMVGIRAGALRTFGGVYLSAKLRERERAEQIRLLYVAMTRAKRRFNLVRWSLYEQKTFSR